MPSEKDLRIPTTPKALIQALLKGAGTGKPKPKS